MSDYSDGSGQIARRPRVNDGPPPVSGVVAIVLAVIAVVAGYFILRSITDDSDTAGVTSPGGIEAPSDDGSTTADTTPSSAPTVGSLAPVPTTPPSLVTTGATVIVANANGVGGSAGQAARVLANSAGFQLTEAPTDATDTTPELEVSAIYYDPANPAAQTVATSLNVVMHGALAVNPMPAEIPVQGGDLKGAGVLLMLGRDYADMTPGALDLTQIDQSAANATAATDAPTAATTASTAAP